MRVLNECAEENLQLVTVIIKNGECTWYKAGRCVINTRTTSLESYESLMSGCMGNNVYLTHFFLATHQIEQPQKEP